MRFRGRLILMAALFAGFAPSLGRADFAIRDGDTVVLLGDSITAARTYGKIIENYTLLRFPERKVRFINSGWGGDTAAGGLKRLDRDVFAHGATVLIVAYGINDIGWGGKADAEHRQLYLDSIREIVARCKQHGVRVFICSASITAEDPERAETGFLQTMCDEGMAIAREQGEGAIDVQRWMRDVQRRVVAANAKAKEEKDKTSLHASDGIHLNDLGHLAMAVAILKGLGAPPEVSSATIDAEKPGVSEAAGCTITNVSGDTSRLEFDRLDEGLPINFGLFGALNYRFVPVPEALNGYRLAVTGLPEGRYDVLAEGRPLGTFDAARLAKGVNLASATADGWEPGGPWEVKAWGLVELTNARNDLAQSLRTLDHFLPENPDRESTHDQAAATNDRLEALQRTVARPRPFRFEIRAAAPKSP